MAVGFKMELSVQSSVEHLETIRKFIAEAAARIGLEENEGYKIVLAVDEACSNIIRHGYHKDKAQKLHLIVIATNTELSVIVNDSGRSYDIRNHQLPDMNDYFAERKSGGLGIKLIRTLVDEIDYEQIDGQNKLVLTKRLTNPS